MGTMVINGKKFTIPDGKSISINGSDVIVDGTRVNLGEVTEAKVFNIVIEGNVGDLSGDIQEITINGNAGSAQTVNGDVKINGDVWGSVSTVNGDVKVKGGIQGSASTISGDINSSR